MILFRLGLLLFLSLFVVNCGACSFQRQHTPQKYNYLCLPTNSKVSMTMGMEAQKEAIDGNRFNQNGNLRVAQALRDAWFVGAKLHLDERFNVLGKEGYRFVGIGMYDPEFGAIWVCFEKNTIK
jgi:hypothetical protein